MTEPGLRQARPALVTLAGGTFVYVTAETLPVGLVPQLSAGLHVRPATVGLLVTVYAAMAGLSAIPVTAALEHRSRRQVVVGCVAVLGLSQFLVTAAPDYAVVLAARVSCALTHGVFWSMLPSVAARLVAPGRAGRATAMVFSGNSLALVLGVPAGTALGHAAGWRTAMAVVGAAAVLIAVALRRVLPGPSAEPAPAELVSAGLVTVAHGSGAVTVAAVVIWGAAFTALPVGLQAAVLRVAPRSADTASALFVVAFQIGIGGGALIGSMLVDTGMLAGLGVIGAVLAAAGLLVVLAARQAFPSRPEPQILGD